MTTRIPRTRLALSLSFLLLIAVPPVVLADDTELFTTSANPNVLLMLDTTGSMRGSATGTSVGDLDGDGDANTKMDILWKVVYTLLNADLSTPTFVTTTTTTTTCSTAQARRWNSTTVDSNISSTRSVPVGRGEHQQHQLEPVSRFHLVRGDRPDRVRWAIGEHDVHEQERGVSLPVLFLQREILRQGCTTRVRRFPIPPPQPARRPTTRNNFPTNHTEAMNADFLNNLSIADDNTLLARLGLMTFTTNSSGGTSRSISGTRSRIRRRTPLRSAPPTRTSGAPSRSMPMQAEARPRPRPCTARRPSSTRRTTPARYAGRTSPS